MKVVEIEVKKIEFDNKQPRKEADKAKIKELIRSIRKFGLMNPINILKTNDGKFKLIDGERRTRAFLKMGKEKIPCLIIKEPKNILIRQLITDFHKEKLNDVERSDAIQRLLDDGLSRKFIMLILGIGRTTYTKLKKIQTYNERTRELIKTGVIRSAVLMRLNKFEIHPEREDSIVTEMVKRKQYSERGIGKIIQKNQNFRWIINQHLTDCYVFNRKNERLCELLKRSSKLIDKEIKLAISEGHRELKSNLNELKLSFEKITQSLKKLEEIKDGN